MEKIKFLSALLVAALVTTSIHVPSARADQNDDEARTRFERGVKLYTDGAFDAALIELKRAYELRKSYRILYNIAQVNQQLKDYKEALNSFQRYLQDGGSEIPGERVTEVKKLIAQLKTRVASIKVTANVEGADILVDDVLVGKTPLAEPIVINAGRRRISLTKTGIQTQTRVIDIAGTDIADVNFDITKPTNDNPPPNKDTDKQPDGTLTPKPAKESSVPWVPWAITGVLAVGTGITGVLALGAQSNLSDERKSTTATRSKLDDAQSKTKTLALVTDVLLVSTVIMGGISIYLTATSGSSSTKEQPPASTVSFGVGPGSVALHGTW
jgi:ribosomal protein L29